MAAHRYWRLALLGSVVTLATVELRASVGGADVAAGASRSGTGSVAAWFDGAAGTEATASMPWLTFDFAAPQTVAEVALRTGAAGTGVPWGVALYWSDDASVWTLAAPVADTSALGAAATWTLSALPGVASAGHVAAGAVHWSGASAGAAGGRVVDNVRHCDAEDGGVYRIAGTVAIDGTPIVPVARRVRLFHRLSGRLVRETWSDAASGAFEFTGLRFGTYMVLAHDHTAAFEAVSADSVVDVP